MPCEAEQSEGGDEVSEVGAPLEVHPGADPRRRLGRPERPERLRWGRTVAMRVDESKPLAAGVARLAASGLAADEIAEMRVSVRVVERLLDAA